jgi:hypothetical protein
MQQEARITRPARARNVTMRTREIQALAKAIVDELQGRGMLVARERGMRRLDREKPTQCSSFRTSNEPRDPIDTDDAFESDSYCALVLQDIGVLEPKPKR